MVNYNVSCIIHNQIRITESGLFSPPGFVDVEDGVGNPIRLSWRNDEDACSGQASICQVRGNRDVP